MHHRSSLRSPSETCTLSLHDALPIYSAGEIYVLADSTEGPSGTGGRILKIATIQPQAAVSQKNHGGTRSEEHTSERQSRGHLVCRLLLENKNPRLQHRPSRRRSS